MSVGAETWRIVAVALVLHSLAEDWGEGDVVWPGLHLAVTIATAAVLIWLVAAAVARAACGGRE